MKGGAVKPDGSVRKQTLCQSLLDQQSRSHRNTRLDLETAAGFKTTTDRCGSCLHTSDRSHRLWKKTRKRHGRKTSRRKSEWRLAPWRRSQSKSPGATQSKTPGPCPHRTRSSSRRRLPGPRNRRDTWRKDWPGIDVRSVRRSCHVASTPRLIPAFISGQGLGHAGQRRGYGGGDEARGAATEATGL